VLLLAHFEERTNAVSASECFQLHHCKLPQTGFDGSSVQGALRLCLLTDPDNMFKMADNMLNIVGLTVEVVWSRTPQASRVRLLCGSYWD
jgi:hypothetical protein